MPWPRIITSPVGNAKGRTGAHGDDEFARLKARRSKSIRKAELIRKSRRNPGRARVYRQFMAQPRTLHFPDAEPRAPPHAMQHSHKEPSMGRRWARLEIEVV
jgi:hypothetical protein